MLKDERYDVAVIGGGLAGLSCSILLSGQGHRVALFEKEVYPFHKVCGEYISMESYDFLQSLGVPLAEKNVPFIKRLLVSSPSGKTLSQQLPLGGFGISRYTIDHELFLIAKKAGVEVYDHTKINDVVFENENFTIYSGNRNFSARCVFGSFGKRSNLDVKWSRPFTRQKPNALNNFIAVKYHAELDHPRDQIALHNFKKGYCGISPIEENKTCICYLTTAQNLRENGNSIAQMEENILFRNSYLEKAFNSAKMIYDKPLVISQISFEKKEQVENHLLFAGDAAGMIAPLCGNGMSMALFGSKFAAPLLNNFLHGNTNRATMEKQYCLQWNRAFKRRLTAGKMIQSVFGNEWLSNTMIGTLHHFPGIVKRLILQTHG